MAPEATPGARTRWLTLAAMTLANSMILVDQTAVPLAVPELIRDLGGDLDEGPWILTANILPLAAFMVLGGRLGDLLGLRRVFLTGAVFPKAERGRALGILAGAERGDGVQDARGVHRPAPPHDLALDAGPGALVRAVREGPQSPRRDTTSPELMPP